MTAMIDRGALQHFTLRFLDADLEDRYQVEEGTAGLAGYRIITGATVVIWVIAAVLVPMGTDISPGRATTVGITMALVGLACFLASGWANTMNRQHALASLLTSANGLVILALGASTDFITGYAIAAIMLLFLFGFVSRTRFVHASVRTLVIGVGLGVAVATYGGTGSLLLDVFFFLIAALASLLGLRLIERNRRVSWHQRLVIEEQARSLEVERSESERLLLNVLPASVSARLRSGEQPIADDFVSVSVMFADIVGFTPMAARMSAVEVIEMLGELFSNFDDLVSERGLEKIKTIGDSYMAVGGLPEPMDDHAVRVVDLALALVERASSSRYFSELQLRVGVHSGPAAGGVIGTRKFAYDVWGDTVNLASRLETYGVPGRVHVSEETRALSEAAFEFESRPPIEMRGVGVRSTYLVIGRRPMEAVDSIDEGRALR
ncbi:MAG TPA: adenylate cyclase [Acidimicrobiia bacterium]|nr:adenylate cyclase [Acidimicrobiia bacterium]